MTEHDVPPDFAGLLDLGQGPEAEQPEQPYAPGAFCDTCGHFAGRHDPEGCQGMKGDYDCHCAPRKKDCKVFMWMGTAWPRPWLPAPEGLRASD